MYMVSEQGNFSIIDTIAVPHPYCITPEHVSYASDHCSGMLTAYAIEQAEKQGARCDICKGELSYSEHEIALVIECKLELSTQQGKGTELHNYLLALKDITEQNNFAGFAFKRHASLKV